MKLLCLLFAFGVVGVIPELTSNDVYSNFPVYRNATRHNVVSPTSILYLVVTGAGKRERANMVQRTIGKHITAPDRMVFISDEESDELPMYKVISIPNSTTPLRAYKMSQLKWVNGIILSFSLAPFDWLVFLDDDTFVILSAFKELLSQYDSNQALLIGKRGADCHVICGGAGFAMSHFLLQRLHSRTRDLEQHFDDALRRGENYQSDVVLSHYIINRSLGTIVHSPHLKNFPPLASLHWHIAHNVTPSPVVSFHHIEPDEYRKLYEHYYLDN